MKTANKNNVKIEPIFPYFGGKAKIAAGVWKRFGDPINVVEPFAGGMAFLLLRPLAIEDAKNRHETVNDASPFIANFWRALKNDPTAVAHYACHPSSEIDLHSRHRWLIRQTASLAMAMIEDPFYYDPIVAGFWVYCASLWIGRNMCHPSAIDHAPRQNLRPRNGIFKTAIIDVGIESYFQAFADRLAHVRVTNGDWKRVVGKSVTTEIGETAVFLDPPYALDVERMNSWVSHLDGNGAKPTAVGSDADGQPANRTTGIYINDDSQDVDLLVANVHRWARDNGSDPRMKIAVCGYAGEHDALVERGWESVNWKGDGYKGKQGNRERIYFSPHCLKGAESQLPLFGGYDG